MPVLPPPLRFHASAAHWRRGVVYGLSFLLLAVLGWHTGDAGMLWAATASIWTCLADPGGTARQRLRGLAAVGVGGAVASGAGVVIAGNPLLALAVVGLAGLAAGMVEARGTAAALCAKLLYVVLIAACLHTASEAGGEPTPLALASDYLMGGVCACLLSLALVPSARDTRPRTELLAVFDGLQKLAALLVDAPDAGDDIGPATAAAKRCVRERIEQARAAVEARRGLFDPAALLRYRYLVAIAEAIFALLIVATELRGRSGHGALPLRHLARCVTELREQLAEGLAGHAPDLPALVRSVHLQLKRLYGQVANAGAPPLYHAALGTLARFPAFGAWRAEFRWPRRSLWLTTRNLGAVLTEHLARDARVTRHAVRLALAGVLSLLPAQLWQLNHGYWVAITVIMVLSPQLQTTRRITVHRFAGSLAGALIGSAVGLLHPAPPAALGISAACLAVAYVARLAGNFGVFALMLTPAVILFSWVGQPAADSSHFAVLRGLDTALGCLIALCCYLLLAQRAELSRMRRAASEAIAVNAVYLRAALAQAMAPGWEAGAEARLEALRVAAGRSSARAEQALEQAGDDLEPALAAEFSRLHVTVRAMAALAGLVRAEATANDAPQPASAEVGVRLTALQGELATLAARPGAVPRMAPVKSETDGMAQPGATVSPGWRDSFLVEQIELARRHVEGLHAGMARIAAMAPATASRRLRLLGPA